MTVVSLRSTIIRHCHSYEAIIAKEKNDSGLKRLIYIELKAILWFFSAGTTEISTIPGFITVDRYSVLLYGPSPNVPKWYCCMGYCWATAVWAREVPLGPGTVEYEQGTSSRFRRVAPCCELEYYDYPAQIQLFEY